MIKVLNVCGARPNFMKIAPLMRAYRSRPEIQPILVHTGQHYDENMSRLFFRDLDIPEPDLNLDVGSASHAVQTALIMTRIEPVIMQERPDRLVVVGDVNSTIAAALVASKLGIPVAHVEAGLRSFDRTMPEEINRLLTDQLSDRLFVTEPSAIENLTREGIDGQRIHHVGNVMADTLLAYQSTAEQTPILDELRLRPREYGLLTLHRPSSVDCAATLARVADALVQICNDIPLVFPMHPRTSNMIDQAGLTDRFTGIQGLQIIPPAGYLEFAHLMQKAAVVLTDSGGIQEETTILNVWCLTLRDNTERAVAVTAGTNQLVGTDPDRIVAACQKCLNAPVPARLRPDKWDGHAAERIAAILADEHATSRQRSR